MPYKDKEKQYEAQRRWEQAHRRRERTPEEKEKRREASRLYYFYKRYGKEPPAERTYRGLTRSERGSDQQREAGLKRLLREAKSVPCTDCGGTFIPQAMDFDHVRGEKEFALSDARVSRHSRAAVLAEIAKCEVVCATCHRIRTVRRWEEAAAAKYSEN